jgi:hypothetical protein
MFTHGLTFALALTAQSPVAPVVEGPVAAPSPAPAQSMAATDPVPTRPEGFVMSATLGVQYLPIFPIPSGELSVFLGGVAPTLTRKPGRWLALGYRGTLSLGMADIFLTERFLFGHRHHFALQGAAGRRGHFYYGASAGVAIFTGMPPSSPGAQRQRSDYALEGEGRIGGIFGDGATQLIVGMNLRVSGHVAGDPDGHGPGAFPTLGAFIGFNFGHGLRRR